MHLFRAKICRLTFTCSIQYLFSPSEVIFPGPSHSTQLPVIIGVRVYCYLIFPASIQDQGPLSNVLFLCQPQKDFFLALGLTKVEI